MAKQLTPVTLPDDWTPPPKKKATLPPMSWTDKYIEVMNKKHLTHDQKMDEFEAFKSTTAAIKFGTTVGYASVHETAIKKDNFVNLAGILVDGKTGSPVHNFKDATAIAEKANLAKETMDSLNQQVAESFSVPAAILSSESPPPAKPLDDGSWLAKIHQDSTTPANTTAMKSAIVAAAAKGFKVNKAHFLVKTTQDSVPNTHVRNPETAPLTPPEPTRKRRIILDD